MKRYVVTGVPLKAQIAARIRGGVTARKLALEGKTKRGMPHRVMGQEVVAFCDRQLAEDCRDEMLKRGLVVTLRRWKP